MDREKRLSHDRAQTATVLVDPVQTFVDDLLLDVHPRWRQFCPREERKLPQDEKIHRLRTAILR